MWIFNLLTSPAASCVPPCCWWWCAWLWPSPWGWPPPHYPPPPLPSAYSASWQSLSSWCWFVIWATQPLFVESLWNQNWVYSLINHRVCCLILSLWQEGESQSNQIDDVYLKVRCSNLTLYFGKQFPIFKYLIHITSYISLSFAQTQATKANIRSWDGEAK